MSDVHEYHGGEVENLNMQKWYTNKEQLTSGTFKCESELMENEEAVMGRAEIKGMQKHSSGNNTNTGITFINRLKEPVTYYWFNFQG